MPPKNKQYTSVEIGNLFKENLSRTTSRPTIYSYVPHEKQIEFHSAAERGRLYIGGNRSGKTVGGVVEDIWRLEGKHPYLYVKRPPIKGRIVTVSYLEGINKIIIPELTKWLPPSSLINGSWEDSYKKAERTLTLANGSSVELMSYDQDTEKFAGTSRDFVHFDEEPPKDIFDECRMRLIDVKGSWWMTMTPVEGMTWVYDQVYIPGLAPGGNIKVVSIDSSENPYISNAELEVVLEGLDTNERKARKQGKFVSLGGLAFKTFDPDTHVIPELTKKQLDAISGWTHYASMDHGLNNPTAWLWHAVSPQGHVITYDEIYKNETLIATFAQMIHDRHKLPSRRPVDLYIGDPAISQRNGQTGDSVQLAYVKEDIPIMLGNNDVRAGIEKMNAYLKTGKWAITENCFHLIREMQRLRWKIYQTAKQRQDNNPRAELHKKDDHAPDSARYFFSFMPGELYVPPMEQKDPTALANMNTQGALLATTPQQGPIYIDRGLQRDLAPSTEWSYIDEHMGGLC